MVNPQRSETEDQKGGGTFHAVEPGPAADDTPVLLGRTHISEQRPLAPMGREFPALLGDLDPVDWDPLLRSGEAPLSDAELEAGGSNGLVLGDFQVVRKLGVGGFGAVYLARSVSGKGEVALKVLARSKAIRPDFLQRFYREARTLARLEHPHIVRGFEPFESRGWHCFAMEFIDGDSLHTWLKRLGKLKVGDVVHIALCVASALQYAHELNLVHRDIKPENILLTRQGLVKLADLGLAKLTDEDLSLTRSGTGFGTPYYMAPEQARNAKHVDPRSDIYALGTTLFHCLTGELPFKGDTALELILAKEQSPLPAMRRFNSEVSEQLDLLIYKMLAKNIHHRYQNCAELSRDLQRLDMANAQLSFVGAPLGRDPSSAESVLDSPGAVTRQFSIAVKPPSSIHEEKQPDRWWQVRSNNSAGQAVVRRLTTRQLQELIKEEHFDIKSEARAEDGGQEFQAVMSFPEFQVSVLKRQSSSVKGSSDSSVHLQKVYQQAQMRHAQEQERFRREQEEAARVPDWPKKEHVEEGIDSLNQLWEKSKNTTLGRVLVISGCVLGGLIGLWGFFKIVSVFFGK
jgi:serine/threonine-protein kinase